ncbi:MAG: hypothetical protein R3255_02575 [Candidatus Lokiarchaeia archaeon]|nr:hypothetical protein [Candidatus Lokiarchaeia archaeon]
MSNNTPKIKLKRFIFILFFLFLGMQISNITIKSSVYQIIFPINMSAGLARYEATLGYPYNWIDASSGIELILADDDSALTKLPFNFTFYDNTFEEIYVITEGYLTFSFKSVLTSGIIIPSSHPHRQNIIAPFWTNLDGTSGNTYIKNFTSYWVVAWENINHDNGSFAGSFEAVLYNDGDIIFNYDELHNVSTYACGLNYGDGNNYSSYNELASGVNDFSIKFSLTIGGDNSGIDGNIINIIVGVVVTLSIVGTAGAITLYYYK